MVKDFGLFLAKNNVLNESGRGGRQEMNMSERWKNCRIVEKSEKKAQAKIKSETVKK